MQRIRAKRFVMPHSKAQPAQPPRGASQTLAQFQAPRQRETSEFLENSEVWGKAAS